MLWLALHLPQLPLQAFAATLGSVQHALPLALLHEHRIQAVNAVAARCGVQPGQQRATALALAPQLLFGQTCAAREAQALQAVAHAALAFSPSVCLEPPGRHTVLLEVHASLRYFGGLARLQQRLQAALAPLGLRWCLAAAPTASGAALLAHWREGFNLGPHVTDTAALQRLLDGAPLALLAHGAEHAAALRDMGLHALADLRRLPREGLARRFGPALLDELDRARGEAADPRQWLQPAPQFDARLELFDRADNTAQLQGPAQLLLAQLVAWAQAQHAQVAAFSLQLQHEPRHRADAEQVPAHTALEVALAEASSDSAHLQMLLRERLARLLLPAPTQHMRLQCSQLQHRAAPNGELFPTRASQQEGLLRLVERLQARLGAAQVQRLAPQADHRPERSSPLQPVDPARLASTLRAAASRAGAAAEGRGRGRAGPQAAAPAPATSPLPQGLPQATPQTLPQARPVWLLPQPQPLPEQRAGPLFEGRPLQLLAGPERIESGWWDGEPTARDYFIAQAASGALLWVFRQRPALQPAADAGWFLHGRFG